MITNVKGLQLWLYKATFSMFINNKFTDFTRYFAVDIDNFEEATKYIKGYFSTHELIAIERIQ